MRTNNQCAAGSCSFFTPHSRDVYRELSKRSTFCRCQKRHQRMSQEIKLTKPVVCVRAAGIIITWSREKTTLPRHKKSDSAEEKDDNLKATGEKKDNRNDNTKANGKENDNGAPNCHFFPRWYDIDILFAVFKLENNQQKQKLITSTERKQSEVTLHKFKHKLTRVRGLCMPF